MQLQSCSTGDYSNDFTKPLFAKENSINSLTLAEKIQVVREIGYAALPNIVSSIGSLLKDAISLLFIGHLNDALLMAALGFGLTWSNAFATAVIFGFAAGFGTVASQAYGANNYRKFGLLYQKILVISSMVLVGICFLLWFTRAQLIAIGFEVELSEKVGEFIRYLMLDFFLAMLFEITRFYLVAQNCFYIPACISVITTVLHIFWCHLFINMLGWELVGMSFARTITDGTSAALILYYAHYKNPCPQSWFPWDPECLKDIGSFLKEIASHGSSVYAEWIAFEISTIIVGIMGSLPILAAHAATLNYIFLNYNVTFGFTLSMSVYVGNAAGEGSLKKAQKYAFVGLVMNFILITCLDLFMITFREFISYFYTDEPTVKSYISIMLTFYFFGMHGDLGCNILAYLLRTLGQDRYVLKCYLSSYFGFGVTASIVTGLWLKYGYVGVWFSLITGCWIMFCLNAYRFYNLNWKQEIEKIYHDMKHDGTQTHEDIELELM